LNDCRHKAAHLLEVNSCHLRLFNVCKVCLS
jgi:hypothetical protein